MRRLGQDLRHYPVFFCDLLDDFDGWRCEPSERLTEVFMVAAKCLQPNVPRRRIGVIYAVVRPKGPKFFELPAPPYDFDGFRNYDLVSFDFGFTHDSLHAVEIGIRTIADI